MEIILRNNPNDQFAQKKLEQIEKKRKFYLSLIEIVFPITIGITIGLFSLYITQPIYNILETIK